MTPDHIRKMADNHLCGTITPSHDLETSLALRVLADLVEACYKENYRSCGSHEYHPINKALDELEKLT